MDAMPIFAALVVGAALAVSGATLQSVLRNPLAEPYILGIVGGASLGVALAFLMGWTAASALVVPLAAVAGAGLSLALVCAVSALAARRTGRRGFSGGTVIVAGFVAGSFTCSLQMLALAYATPEQAAAASRWVWGDLRAASPLAVPYAAAAVLAALVALYACNRSLNALVLGEATARSLGVNVRRTQLIALGATSVATAASVALAGAVGFLGLIVPHVVRRLVGVNHRVYLPLSAVGGAVFLVAADAVARLFPGNLPVGVVCALTGAPFFFLLLARRG
ncbi:MAG: FecCD family ABC transporter permease [Kiritimatiellia bacterium]